MGGCGDMIDRKCLVTADVSRNIFSPGNADTLMVQEPLPKVPVFFFFCHGGLDNLNIKQISGAITLSYSYESIILPKILAVCSFYSSYSFS